MELQSTEQGRGWVWLDFSGAECMEWMREAGFGNTRLEGLVAGQSMVIGQK